MGDFLRNNRYASSIITTVVLIVIGFLVGVTRDDSGNRPNVILRADEQALRPQATIFTPPTSDPQALRSPTTSSLNHTLPNIGGFKLPASSARPNLGGGGITPGGTGGGGSTSTTTLSLGGGATTTTTLRTSPFAANRIAYSAGGSMWTANPDGLDARSVANSGYYPAWSPDHKTIAYADADNPGGALWVLNANGGRFGLTTGVVQDAQPAWSPDGTKLAFSRIDNTAGKTYSSIWIVHSDGANLHPIATSECTNAEASINRDPSWSPDGTKIAFWSSRDHCDTGKAYELYVLNLTTSEVDRLATESNSGAPTWSPDNKTLAFSSDGYGGVGMEIVLINVATKAAHRITNLSGDDTDPAWSPDGSRIAFRSDRQNGGIFTMNTNGSDVQLVVAGGYQPSWR